MFCAYYTTFQATDARIKNTELGKEGMEIQRLSMIVDAPNTPIPTPSRIFRYSNPFKNFPHKILIL